MKLLLTVVPEMSGIRSFVEDLTSFGPWDGLELPGHVLGQGAKMDQLLSSIKVPLYHLNGLLPDSVARYVPEASAGAKDKLSAYIRGQIEQAAAHNFSCATLDLGADRIGVHNFREDLDARVAMVKSIADLAEALEITICIPQRLPEAQPRPGVDYATQLVNEISHGSCKLVVNVFPDELDDDFNVEEMLNANHFNIAVIRFHFEPALGIRITDAQHERWANALRWQGYKGQIVFCPRLDSVEQLRVECSRLEETLADIWQAEEDE